MDLSEEEDLGSRGNFMARVLVRVLTFPLWSFGTLLSLFSIYLCLSSVILFLFLFFFLLLRVLYFDCDKQRLFLCGSCFLLFVCLLVNLSST